MICLDNDSDGDDDDDGGGDDVDANKLVSLCE